MSLDDAFILAGTHGLSGAFGWLLCSVAARARAERVRRQREQILVWAENAEREAEMARLSCPPPIGHPGYDVLARELGLVCPPDPSGLEVDMVAEQNRRSVLSFDDVVIDLRDPNGGAR